MQSAIAMNRSYEKIVADRVEVALIAMMAGSPLVRDTNSFTATASNLIVNHGNWHEVVHNHVFLLISPDPRVSILPLAIGDSLTEGSAGHEGLRELCDGLVGEGYISPGNFAFMYISALLVGYTIHRRYEVSDLRNTKDWLSDTLRRFCSDIPKEIADAELARFEPFFTEPSRFVELKDPYLTTVLNTLVAIHTLDTPQNWKKKSGYSHAKCISGKFFETCSHLWAVK